MGRTMYRRLLALLPRGFRAEWAEEMCRAVDDHWYELRVHAGVWMRVRFWLRQYFAVLKVAVALRLGGERRSVSPVPVMFESGEGGITLDSLLRDTQHALRTFLKHPGFTAVTVLTLALGIGTSTTIFSAVQTVLLRPLPYDDSGRVAVVFERDLESGQRSAGVSAANIVDLRRGTQTLSAVSVAEPWSLDLRLEDSAQSLRAWAVSEDFFDAIGSPAALGRTFLPEEYVQGSDRVAVLGHRSWVNRFGRDADIIGSTLTLDGEPYTVVGVLPRAFHFPGPAELWIPRPPQDDDAASRTAAFMTGIARLAPEVSLAQAQADIDRVAASMAAEYAQTNAATGMVLVPLREHLFGDARTPLLVLFGSVCLVLLIACANVAGLMLSRGIRRQREYTLRSALGAGRRRLMQHVAVESLLLAAAGCLLGIALTYGGVQLIQSLGPDHLPRIDELHVDGTVLAFAAAVAAMSAFLSGLVPTMRLSRPDLRGNLLEGARGTTGSGHSLTLRNHLVVAEIAGAVILLIGAGLLSRSFALLLDEELGFESTGRIAAQVFAYDYDPDARLAFVDRSIENIETIPGVRRVALTTSLPGATDATISSIEMNRPFTVDGRAAPPAGQEPIASISMVSADYWSVLGIRVVAGRSFDERDHSEAPPVIMINETLARQQFAERSPIGRNLTVQFREPVITREVVGVVRDVRPLGHDSVPRPEVYFPLTQVPHGALTFVAELEPGINVPATALMEAIWDVNPAQSVWGAASLESLLSEWLKERRFNLTLLAGLAAIALTLAMVGIYGLISYSVEQRMDELGIRRALGAQSRHLLTMMLRHASMLAGAGIVVGLLGAVALTRFISSMLFGVEAIDPVTFVLLPTAVFVVAALAASVPALRAVRADPLATLRE